jgi:hypothetical protein
LNPSKVGLKSFFLEWTSRNPTDHSLIRTHALVYEKAIVTVVLASRHFMLGVSPTALALE